MTDQLDFERRLEARLQARAALASRSFDAAMIAHRAVASVGRQRHARTLEWPWRRGSLERPGLQVRWPGGQLAYLLIFLGVLLALIAGAIAAGALRPREARAPAWIATGGMRSACPGGTATLLSDGRVLVAGGSSELLYACASAEVYDPASGTWTATRNMPTARLGATAALLSSGKVLVAGGMGYGNPSVLASAELYDPGSGTWTETVAMATPRVLATSTLLRDGKVLVVGGGCAGSSGGAGCDVASAGELYDPATGTWSVTRPTVTPRCAGGTATLLHDGTVLIAGGTCFDLSPSGPPFAERYDPGRGAWTATGIGAPSPVSTTATLLADGKVLVVSGRDLNNVLSASAQLFDPANGTWTPASGMPIPLFGSSTLLPGGDVLVMGNADGGGAAAELYHPATGSWTVTAMPRLDGSAVALPGGKVLVVGGDPGGGIAAELYDPGSP